jgi:undecaprenyl-diphosphatase
MYGNLPATVLTMTIAHRWLAGAAVILIVALSAGVPFIGRPENELPGVFSSGGAIIGPMQTVGKLLVADGDAVVYGRVAGWLAVVGGNLVLKAGGQLDGPLLILGGSFQNETVMPAGSPVRLVLPPGSPLIGALPWLLGGAATAAMLATAWLVWYLAGYMKRTGYLRRGLDGLHAYGRRWPGFYALTGVAVSGFLLAAFAHLSAETIFHNEADLFDHAVIWLVRRFASPAADKAMIIITVFGSGVIYAVFAPLAAGWALWLGRWREAASLAVCLGGAALLNFLLKHLFERARPEEFKIISAAGYSFPSGHAMVSLCFYGMVAFLICRHIQRLGRQMVLYGLTAALVSAIGLSRVYLGVHYPSDVLGGYFAGGTWLVWCVSLLWWWEMDSARLVKAGPDRQR